MTFLPDVSGMIEVNTDATVSRTVLKAEGVRVVLFAFDAGEELSEHTAAMPVMLGLLDGSITVTAGGETVELRPGGLIHLPTRLPHTVVANEPTRMVLTMLDGRV